MTLSPTLRGLELITFDPNNPDLHLEIALVTPTMVRVRYSTPAAPPRRSWAVAAADDAFDMPTFTSEENGQATVLQTDSLIVTVDTASGGIIITTKAGQILSHDAAPITVQATTFPLLATKTEDDGANLPESAKTELALSKKLHPDEVILGAGQRTGLPDKRGRHLTHWTVDPAWGHSRNQDNLYQAHPFLLALRPGVAWGLFLNSTWYSTFNIGAEERDRLHITTLGGALEYYFIYGPTPADVLDSFTQLTGRPALPPLWALGYHQSRWSYLDADTIRTLANEFRTRNIPLDVIHFDIDYMRGYRNFTWNPQTFPDPAGLIAELKEQGIRAVTIIDPGVKNDPDAGYPVADSGLAGDHFIQNPDGSTFVGYCWPDAALFPDFTREATRHWWGEQHKEYLDAGVAGLWNDMNEPAIFDRPFSEGFSEQKPMPLTTPQGTDDERTVHLETHNLYGLLMGRATYEGLRALRPTERPWILTRSGTTGTQRYAFSWMGDNSSWWEHLEMSVAQLGNMGLSGNPFVGVDIGGFFDNAWPELYARWIELGTFYPFMRTHTAAGTGQQEPWSFGPQVEQIARRAIELRYRLLPYLYTLAHHAHQTGAPIFRPLCYDFPNDPATYHLHTQIMVGPHLLVAPVTQPGTDHRLVYLPAGLWYDWYTGEQVQGPTHRVVDAPLGRIPLWVRGGAILPLGNVRQSTADPLTEMTFHTYPDPSRKSNFQLIEDDGISYNHEQGEFSETTVRLAQMNKTIRILLEEREGTHQLHPRHLTFKVHLPTSPGVVFKDNNPVTDWLWDSATRTLTLGWDDDGQEHQILIGPQLERLADPFIFEEFFGMWADREEMRDSTAWVRKLREEWE